MRTTYIVTYDVRNDKRLRKTFKICKAYGTHLQLSVFECDLNETDYVKLKYELNEVINSKEDQVLFIELGPTASRGGRVIEALGTAYSKMDASCYVV